VQDGGGWGGGGGGGKDSHMKKVGDARGLC